MVDSEKVPLFQHQIAGLSPRTSYEIEITARNDVGWSESNERFIFTTSGSKINYCLMLSAVISLTNNSDSNNNKHKVQCAVCILQVYRVQVRD